MVAIAIKQTKKMHITFALVISFWEYLCMWKMMTLEKVS